jgi:selenide,water dikinase
MRCGGCAAKLGEPMLHRALARLGVRHDPTVLLGLATPDDAAAVATPRGDVVVATVDAFRAFTDDPWLVGRVAAVNALSDVFAVGAVPRWALAWVAVPDGGDGERAEETLFQVLAGVRAALDADGVALVGGHTTAGEELSVGLAVWGHPAGGPGDARRGGPPLLQLGGLSPGDRLILTKPLGTGVLFAADAQGRARGPWIEAALGSMMRSNAAAARVMRAVGATAATDVSGFGLVGHLAGMLRASKASARLPLELVPLLPGARGCLALGLRSTFHPENARARSTLAIAPAAAGQPALEALFDPQTSGGLLFGVPAARADEAVARLREDGDGAAACIGTVEPPRPDAALVEVLAGNRLGGP